MPRGNPTFGRDVKSPGRPRKPRPAEDAQQAKTETEHFIAQHVPEYLQTLHDAATRKTTNDVKIAVNAANLLLTRIFGPAEAVRPTGEAALVGLVRDLINLRQPAENITVITPEVKELPPGS